MSNTLAHFQHQMQALGPSVEWIDALIQEDEQSWSVSTVQGLAIGISYIKQPARLILSACMGQPEEAERESVYTTMLCSNLLCADQASLRVALTGPEGELLLISEFTPNEWTLAEITDAILDFSATTKNFIEVIEISVDDMIGTFQHTNPSVRI